MGEIVRLSFPEYGGWRSGIPYREEFIDPSKTLALLARYSSLTRVLQEGVYNLTPKIWVTHKARHELVVLGTGHALYRVIPKSEDTAVVKATVFSNVVFGEIIPGGRTIKIPEEEKVIVVAGGSELHPNQIRIYEVIAYVEKSATVISLPGRSLSQSP